MSGQASEDAPRIWTYRDAGLHSSVLRALNAMGSGLRRIGVVRPTLSPDALQRAACRHAELDDFAGDDFDADGLREGLEVLCRSIERESRLSTFGRIAMRGLLVGVLSNRLKLLDWAKRHPEVRAEKIERPFVVIGLPRTGTSLLSILLGLDPAVRPLVQWEASHPVPPPTLAAHAEDPRIAEAAGIFEKLQGLNPALRAMHPLGATLATECVTLFVFDMRSLLIETQAFVPSYGCWLDATDMRDAYRLHRLTLQVLQSKLPTETWSLKSPNHLWCLDTLLETYPDARVIWTHRDLRKVVPSLASLVTSIQRGNACVTDPVGVGAYWSNKVEGALARAMDFDARQAGMDWCSHVRYADLMTDPIETVRGIYAHFGEVVHPLHERRMAVWMRDRGQDAFGRHGYAYADFGLDSEAIDARYAAYRERYDVPREG